MGNLHGKPWQSPIEFLVANARQLVSSCTGLVGEVFTEKERSITNLYEAILRLVAEGLWRPPEIAGLLASRGLLAGGAPAVTGVLNKLAKMGLIDKLTLWKTGRARVYYRHKSPLLSIIYYLEQKFGISDSYTTNPATTRAAFGREVEYCIGELLAQRAGGEYAYHVTPREEADIIILPELL